MDLGEDQQPVFNHSHLSAVGLSAPGRFGDLTGWTSLCVEEVCAEFIVCWISVRSCYYW